MMERIEEAELMRLISNIADSLAEIREELALLRTDGIILKK